MNKFSDIILAIPTYMTSHAAADNLANLETRRTHQIDVIIRLSISLRHKRHLER